MKPLLAILVAIVVASSCRAGPAEKAIVAAVKLSEQPNYSWISTVADDARTYEIEGKTDSSGYTWMRLPMVKSIARRLGRDAESEIEAFFKGSTAAVIRTEQGWRHLRELPSTRWEWSDDVELWSVPATRGGRASAVALSGLDPWSPPPPVALRRPRMDDEDDTRVYSNAQFAVNRPHEELAVIVSSFTDIKADGDYLTGTLTDLGAQLLLVRDGQEHIAPVCAAGTFKLQISSGIVTKYALRLEGILLVQRKKIHVRQDSTTLVKRIGSTRLEVPTVVRWKLEEN